MNRVIAYELLVGELETYRNFSYEELRSLLGEDSKRDRLGPDGIQYQIEFGIRWRNELSRDILVRGVATNSDWGAPHDAVSEEFVVPMPMSTSPDSG